MRTETEEEMYEERVHSDLLDTEDETEEITKESWDDKGENEQKMTKTIEELLSRVSVFSFGKEEARIEVAVVLCAVVVVAGGRVPPGVFSSPEGT